MLPTSPTFLNLLLLSGAWERHDLSSLKRITYGTEPMPESTLRRVNEILPHVDFLQTYGLSELGILRSKSRDSSSLWVKVGGDEFETKVVNGVLWIKARSAMLGYLNHPVPRRRRLVRYRRCRRSRRRVDPHPGTAVRSDQRGGQKVYPAEVESVLLQMPGVRDVRVFGEPSAIMGSVVAAYVDLEKDYARDEFKKSMRKFCRDRIEAYKVPVKVDYGHDPQYTERYKKNRAPVA